MNFDGFEFVRVERPGHSAVSFCRGLLCFSAFVGTLMLYQFFSDPGLFAGGMKDMLYAPPPPPPPGPRVIEVAPARATERPAATPQTNNPTFYEPTRIPKQALIIIDGPEVLGSGIPGAISSVNDIGCLGCIAFGGPSNSGFVLPPPPPVVPVNPPPPPLPAVGPQRREPVRLGGNVVEGFLVNKVQPQYPTLARAVKVEGNVILSAVISKEGRIEQLNVVSGHPLLSQAALDAVSQWRYRPYLLNDEAVEVVTTITVIFSFGR